MDAFSHDVTNDVLPTTLTPNKWLQGNSDVPRTFRVEYVKGVLLSHEVSTPSEFPMLCRLLVKLVHSEEIVHT